MVTPTIQHLRREADLMERFAQSYRRKFADLIERLNRADAPSDLQCVRLCVEAVDMMLATQSQVAKGIRELTETPAPARKVA